MGSSGAGGGGALGTSVPSPAQASAAGTANSSYLKPVSMANSASAAVQGKSPAASSLPANASTVKKANTPKINFVGKNR